MINKVTPEEKYYAQTLHRYGVSVKDIVNELGRGESTIYRWINPEQERKHREHLTKWRKENPEKHNKYNKKWLDANPEKQREAQNKWVEDNRDKVNEYMRSWYKTSKGRQHSAAMWNQRKARLSNTDEMVFIDNQWLEIDRTETWRVFKECLLPKDENSLIEELYAEARARSTDEIKYHIDHIKPLSKGGEHRLYNLQILQDWENISKNAAFTQEEVSILAYRMFESTEYFTSI